MVDDNELNDQPTGPSLNGIPVGSRRGTDDDLNLADYKVRKKSYAHLIDPTLPPEEARKQRRAISNRESAKRARLRKELEVQDLKETLDNAQAEVITLKTENTMLRQYIRSLTEANAAGNSLAHQFSRSMAAAAGTAGAPSPKINGGKGGGGANSRKRSNAAANKQNGGDGTVLRGSPISLFPTTASQLLAQLQLPPLTLQQARGSNTGGSGGGAQQQQQQQQDGGGCGGGVAKSSFSLLPWDQINQSIPEEILKTLQDDTFLAGI